jgi:glycosyltransferase involved in cell wall biosynthesis
MEIINNSMAKVSIIVPVFNVEKYLEECLDSLVRQTFQDVEIILVDDDSADASLDIMNTFAGINNRIRKVSQHNRGVSPTRNVGLYLAAGDYILCVDSDDTILPDTIERLYNRAIETEADIVMENALICTKALHAATKVSFIDFKYYYRQRAGSMTNSDNYVYRAPSYFTVTQELQEHIPENVQLSAETIGNVYLRIFIIFYDICCLLYKVRLTNCAYFAKLLLVIYPSLTYPQQHSCLSYLL